MAKNMAKSNRAQRRNLILSIGVVTYLVLTAALPFWWMILNDDKQQRMATWWSSMAQHRDYVPSHSSWVHGSGSNKTAKRRGKRSLEKRQQPDEEHPSIWVQKPEWKPLDCNMILQNVFGTGPASTNSSKSALIQRRRQRPLPTQDPNHGALHARLVTNISSSSQPFWISLHSQRVDPVRWTCIMEQGLYYERELTRIFERILRDSPAQARVVDVGGNIGWYALLTAFSLHHHVDVVEPVEMNVLRLCQSVQLNSWSLSSSSSSSSAWITEEDEINTRTKKRPSIHIRQQAMVDGETARNHKDMSLTMHWRNPGQAKIVTPDRGSASQRQEQQLYKHHKHQEQQQHPPNSTTTASSGESDSHNMVHVTTLDTMAQDLGWFDLEGGGGEDDESQNTKNMKDESNQTQKATIHSPSPPPRRPIIAILKIDVEGVETKVIAGAQRLLQSGMVQNIILEVSRDDDDDEEKEEKSHKNNNNNEPMSSSTTTTTTTTRMLESIFQAGYRLHNWGRFVGPNMFVPPDYPRAGSSADQAHYIRTRFLLADPRHKRVNLWFRAAATATATTTTTSTKLATPLLGLQKS
ncbi:hypothetical protein ACA910_015985 [Epithemia clementina (nom. ined.)]